MKYLLAALALTLSTSAFAETGYLTGSELRGLNKICFYSSASGGFAITIKAARVCPVSYKR